MFSMNFTIKSMVLLAECSNGMTRTVSGTFDVSTVPVAILIHHLAEYALPLICVYFVSSSPTHWHWKHLSSANTSNSFRSNALIAQYIQAHAIHLAVPNERSNCCVLNQLCQCVYVCKCEYLQLQRNAAQRVTTSRSNQHCGIPVLTLFKPSPFPSICYCTMCNKKSLKITKYKRLVSYAHDFFQILYLIIIHNLIWLVNIKRL